MPSSIAKHTPNLRKYLGKSRLTLPDYRSAQILRFVLFLVLSKILSEICANPCEIADKKSFEPIISDSLAQKSQIGRREPVEIREDGAHVCAIHTKPICERCGILIHRCRRNPAPSAGIIGAADDQCGEGAICPLPLHGSAKHEMMATPAVIASLAVAGESAAEIARCERCYALGECRVAVLSADGSRCVVQSIDALAQFREETRLRTDNDLGVVSGRAAGIFGLIRVRSYPPTWTKNIWRFIPNRRPRGR